MDALTAVVRLRGLVATCVLATAAGACIDNSYDPTSDNDDDNGRRPASAMDAAARDAGATGLRDGGTRPADGGSRADGASARRDGGNVGGGLDGANDMGPEDPMLPPPKCGDAGAGDTACSACTHQGVVEGNENDDGCEYLGIPYAQPPVGALRFAPPEPAERWDGVRAATSFGAACVQGMDLSGSDQQSEDCLFINVWGPSGEPAEPLPVMVFIHGGGYTGGATNTYVGRGLAASGPVVVVSMNYRLGALGFFAHPELDRERGDRPAGSDGIRDQQLALRWVRDNIASFHGDPNNVTVFGESAGASAVCVHLVSPGSRNLAKRFVMESGVCTHGVANGIEAISRDQAYATADELAAELCPDAEDVLACLRELPPEQLMTWMREQNTGPGGAPGLSWAPVIEGPGGALPESPDALLERGAFHQGEIIVGTNKNEYGLFQLAQGAVITSREELTERIDAQFGRTDEVLALYAPDEDADPNQAYVTLMTDVMFRCGARRLARTAADQGRAVYLYSFEEGTAVHAEELTPLFGWEYNSFAILPPPEELQRAMQGYWTNFASVGDPNADDLPAWPKYDPAGDAHMTLVDPPSAAEGLQREACDFWDSYLTNPS